MFYAGFWKRFGAGFFDALLVNIISTVFGFVYGFVGSSFYGLTPENFGQMDDIVLIVSSILFYWFYYGCFHSSKYQATPGMMIFSLRVTNYEGEKVSFWRASLRLWASVFSWIMLGIGYLMIAFTSRKQALHDYIARTLVIMAKK